MARGDKMKMAPSKPVKGKGGVAMKPGKKGSASFTDKMEKKDSAV